MRLLPSNIRTFIKALAALVFITVLVSVFLIRVNLEGSFEGFFILKGEHGKLLEIKDDLLLGEYERVIFKLDLPWLHGLFAESPAPTPGEPFIKYAWNTRKGHGYINSYSPDGTRFVICLSRFHDSNNEVPHGLFIGGGLPYSTYEDKTIQLNETGVAYYTGTKWHHIWCNANEAIAGGTSPEKLLFPSQWDCKGSKVLYGTARKIMFQSSHRVQLDGLPFDIDRFLIYRAGDHYFQLIIRIKNSGQTPGGYYYIYGDEPWVGNYGSSAGDVGWAGKRLFLYESIIDPDQYPYAGMFDSGNPLVLGEKGPFSNIANFIEWRGDIKPDLVYFSNKEGNVNPESARVPLASNDNRVIFLQWGPRVLLPNQSETIALAIGMATPGSHSSFPRKPTIDSDWTDMKFIMQAQ
jgi:hypothetical protein